MAQGDWLLIVVLIIPVAVYVILIHMMFMQSYNLFWDVVFISMPVGVMFIGLPILTLTSENEYDRYGKWYRVERLEGHFGEVFAIGFIIFAVGFILTSMTPH
jgi:hypothetical protein